MLRYLLGRIAATIPVVVLISLLVFLLIHAAPGDPADLLLSDEASASDIAEAQRDATNKVGRGSVTNYLRDHWDGTTIMMSMGSLAHYMHDLTELRARVRDFLQEGNEQLWVHAAAQGPRGFVRWVVIEERAEGGDALFQAAQRDPHFLDGFVRVAEGGGVALYRATDPNSQLPTPKVSFSGGWELEVGS